MLAESVPSLSMLRTFSKENFYGEANNGVFYGLPAFISDSLPGKWGDTVFSAWASANNLDEDHLTAVDKLSFIGKRGMGALEFEPSQEIGTGEMSLELDQLYRKAQEILEQREETVIAGKDITLESLYEASIPKPSLRGTTKPAKFVPAKSCCLLIIPITCLNSPRKTITLSQRSRWYTIDLQQWQESL